MCNQPEGAGLNLTRTSVIEGRLQRRAGLCEQRRDLRTMLEYLPALRTLRKFVDAIHRLLATDQSEHQARCRWWALQHNQTFRAVGELALEAAARHGRGADDRPVRAAGRIAGREAEAVAVAELPLLTRRATEPGLTPEPCRSHRHASATRLGGGRSLCERRHAELRARVARVGGEDADGAAVQDAGYEGRGLRNSRER